MKQLGSRSTGRLDASWRDYAACRVTPPELFFPSDGTDVSPEDIDAAKAVCCTCPVRDACLQFALEAKQEHGIWGGTTEEERRRLRRAWMAERRRRTKVPV